MSGWLFHRRLVLSGLAALLMAPAVVAQESRKGQFLIAQKTRRFLLGQDNPPTEAWQFKTSGELPVLYARQGEEFRFRLSNELDEDVWLHVFGVRGPGEFMTIAAAKGPSSEVEVVFTPPDAGTYWIGPLLNASRHRDMGLYALLIVEEAVPLNGLADIPIILDDWKVDDTGQMDMSFGSLDAAIAEGRLGNWFTVNGAFKPRIDVDLSKNNRLRLFNACNTRTLALQFKNIDLIVIAEDGQPVKPRPLPLSNLSLLPGERVDLLVAGMTEQAIIAVDLREDVVEAAFLLASGHPGEGVADNFALPPNPLSEPDLAAAREVPIVLAGGVKGGLQSAKVGEQTLELRQLLEKGLAWAMNGIAGLGGPLLFEAKRGETLLLVIENKTAFAQPLHIHGHVWKLVSTEGQAAEDGAWRDTVEIKANASANLVMVADNPGSWAIQSLIAERCDAGLIGGFAVADMP